jgi:4'-phosphopantetheinyl transferase
MRPLTLAAARPSSGRPNGRIHAGEVHLWLVPLDVPIDTTGQFLDSGELRRAAGYREAAAGARFAASRAALRRLVGSYLDADPASLCFRPGPTGKPAAAVHIPAGDDATGDSCDPVPGFEFSLARTEDLALIAISAAAIGTDIERIRPRPGLADLVANRFPRREAACIAAGCRLPAGPSDRALRGFYRHWTAREAYLKAIGCGLAGLGRVEVSCGPRTVVMAGGVLADGWRLSFPAVSPAHAAAVAASDPVTRFGLLPG